MVKRKGCLAFAFWVVTLSITTVQVVSAEEGVSDFLAERDPVDMFFELEGDPPITDDDPELVVRCHFTCEKPIISCNGWTPPPGSYEKDVEATERFAESACASAAQSVCQRCGGGELAKFWYKTYRSVTWRAVN
ncbi:MAG: hypothetical protein KDD70_09900 [Bdellovibrionales bacterium]|nr:hypothetical protein [Bdellovibrionales bacterium]